MVDPVEELQSNGRKQQGSDKLQGRFRAIKIADPGRCNGLAVQSLGQRWRAGEAVGAMGKCVWALRRMVALGRTAAFGPQEQTQG